MTIDKKDKLSGASRSGFERWSLPEWDHKGNLIEQEQAVAEKKKTEKPVVPELNFPTASELEKIRSDAFQEGKIDGHKQGFEQGLEEGRIAGKQEGVAEGKIEGFEAGKQTGIEAGHTLAEQELNQLRLAFAELLLQLDGQVKSEQADWEKTLVAMVCQLSQSLILTDLQKRPEIIQAIVRKAVLALPDANKRIRIQVHPQHFDMVRDLADKSDGDWHIETNANLSVGGCQVLSDQSLIDYSLEHRFRTQMAAILEEAELNPEILISQMSEPLVQPELFEETENIDVPSTAAEPIEKSMATEFTSQQELGESFSQLASDQEIEQLTDDTKEQLHSDSVTIESEVSQNPEWEENIEQPSNATEPDNRRSNVAENSGGDTSEDLDSKVATDGEINT